ncbi:MAG: methionine--tRNA ligase [Cyanobacteria bacterium P01_H01_bin.74]
MAVPHQADSTTARYFTTAIDYVNALPHLGHAYEKIMTDIMVRYHAMKGHPVYFLTGTDEHGTKVQKSAAEKNLSPQAYTDQLVSGFKESWQYLNIDYTRFIRTTESAHYTVVTQLWQTMAAKGDIYKKRYQGLYCTGCEKFLTERDLSPEARQCTIHFISPEPVEEENYFFALSKYKTAIRDYIQSRDDIILPAYRAADVLKMLDELEDISVSRPKTTVSWGIPVPDDTEQVIYVWIDALSNYLTGIGYHSNPEQFNQFWPSVVHVIGKDILRFHAIYWPAMLLSAGIALPRQIVAHGFININDTKISKSIGNVVSPFDLQARFNLPSADAIRYYLTTAIVSFGQDGGFTEDEFKTKVNADLANNLGNLLNRTLTMTQKYFNGLVPTLPENFPPENLQPENFQQNSVASNGSDCLHAETHENVARLYSQYEFSKAAAECLKLVDWANKAINDQMPWALYKNNQHDDLSVLMYQVLETLRQVAILLFPVMPNVTAAIYSQLGYPDNNSQANPSTSCFKPNWQDLKTPIPSGQIISLGPPVFPRLDSELADKSKKTKQKTKKNETVSQ